MARAADNGFNIVVHIHLDDGLDKGTWRNVMIFDPIAKYGGVTYFDTVVKPTAEAAKAANKNGAPIYFAMQVSRRQDQKHLCICYTAANEMLGKCNQQAPSPDSFGIPMCTRNFTG